MVVGFPWIEVAVAALFLEWDEQEQAASGAQQVPHRTEGFGWINQMFEGVMTDDHVN